MKVVAGVLLSIGACVAGLSPAEAQASAPKPRCATPKGYAIAARDAEAILFQTDSPDTDPQVYRYCALANGKRFPIYAKVGLSATLSDLDLAGAYLASTVTPGANDATAPVSSVTRVVNVLTNKNVSVPDLIASSASTGYSTGCCVSLVLSPTGVLAGVERTYEFGGTFAALADHLIAFQASTGRSVLLDSAPVGTIGAVAIYGCAAGCSSTATSVVGWTSDGRQEYAPASG